MYNTYIPYFSMNVIYNNKIHDNVLLDKIMNINYRSYDIFHEILA